MDAANQKLEALYDIGKHLVEQIEQGRLVDKVGNHFEQNFYFVEFRRLIENCEVLDIDPEVRAFSELMDRRSQIRE